MPGRRDFLKFIMNAGLGFAAASPLQYTPASGSEEEVYLMSYFRTPAEALHLASSLDGYHWMPLNDNEPLLHPVVGANSMRDPFIIEDHNGIFHLLWTDGWESNQIGYCRSADLIHWEEQRLIPMMVEVEHARNCWAPECFYDPETGDYRLVWSTTVNTETDGGWDHRIWTAITTDFESFTPPSLYFDPGYTVIDATLTYDNGRYMMIFKDERRPEENGPQYKALRVAEADSAEGPFENISDLITRTGMEGPTVFRVGDKWLMFYDNYTEPGYAASISDDLLHWEEITEHIIFPERPRHATVFKVTPAILEGLLNAFS